MTRSFRRAIVVAVCALTVVTHATASAQTKTASSSPPAASKASTTATPPDLQGMWVNGTTTPFERAAALGTKAFYTPEEVAAQERTAAERRANANPTATRRAGGDVGGDNEAFMDTGNTITATHQTSLVTDPPDGRIQFLTSADEARARNTTNLDNYETMSPWDRCITRGPTALFPANYNNGYQIIQSPGYVVIVAEMIHEARVVPLDGRPHLPGSVRTWNGDPLGHWEGATLVVDSTNFNGKGWISTHAGSGRLRGTPYSENLHVVERFTRVAADRMDYSMTVDDPTVYARPWTVTIPFTKDDGYQMFEYACHEGNQATELMLRGARVLEKDGAPGKP